MTTSSSSSFIDISDYASAIRFDHQIVNKYWSRLSKDPSDVLKENVKFSSNLLQVFQEEAAMQQDEMLQEDEIVTKVKEMIQINPIGLLSECVAEFCGNSRLNSLSSDCRTKQENYILQTVRDQDTKIEKNSPFAYASVVPGFFFQDLVLLNRIVCETAVLSHRALSIIIIGHREYLNYDFSAPDELKERRLYMLLYKLRLQSCLSFFSQATGIQFPYVLFYSNHQDYLKSLPKSFNRPWIVTAIDFVDDFVTKKMAKDVCDVCAYAPAFPFGKGFCSDGQDDKKVDLVIFSSVPTKEHDPKFEKIILYNSNNKITNKRFCFVLLLRSSLAFSVGFVTAVIFKRLI